MIRKIISYLQGFFYFIKNVKFFNANKILKDKRVVIIGAADSAFKNRQKNYIENFDFIIRLNKAVITWKQEQDEFVGSRTDILFHGFVENFDSGGGGTLDIPLFKKFGVRYLVQPRFDKDGIRNIINFYRKYKASGTRTYLLGASAYKEIKNLFGKYHPTKGFNAIATAIKSNCSEVALIGFTFFKTPYASGYRDNIIDIQSNLKHIADQGLHDVEMEYQNFLKLVNKYHHTKKILVDATLYDILLNESRDYANKVFKIENV